MAMQETVWKACEEGKTDVVLKWLEDKNNDVDMPDADGNTLLHWAAWSKNIYLVSHLLEKKALIEVPNRTLSQTPLHFAAMGGSAPIVHALLNDASSAEELLEMRDDQGFSALHHAAQYGRDHVVLYLLHRGLKVDDEDLEGHTPLHWAIYQDREQTARVLLANGASLTKADSSGYTALHWAATRGNYYIAKLLMDAGADAQAKTLEGKIAQDIALSKHNSLVSNLLHMQAATPALIKKSQPLWWGASAGVLVLLFSLFAFTNFWLAISTFVIVCGAFIWKLEYINELGPSRNPMYLSFFLTFLLLSFLSLAFTDIGSFGMSVIAFLMIAFGLLFATVALHRSNPGFVANPKPVNDVVLEAFREHHSIEHYCPLCQSFTPIRSHHCNTCNKCVARFDHHSHWTDNCIGLDNIVIYIVVIIGAIAFDFWFVYLGLTLPFAIGLKTWLVVTHIVSFCFQVYQFSHVYKALKLNLTQYEVDNFDDIEYLQGTILQNNRFNTGSLVQNLKSWLFSETDWRTAHSLPQQHHIITNPSRV